MQTIESIQPNGSTIRYKIIDGTAYHANAPDAVVAILEQYRKSGRLIDISYGDAATGRDWLEEYGRAGRLGRSTGQIKVPLMIAKPSDFGGGALLDHCIVRIRDGKGAVLWQHPQYHQPKLTFGDNLDVLNEGEPHARFRAEKGRQLWVRKLGVTISPK